MLLAVEKIVPHSGFSRVAYAQPFLWMISKIRFCGELFVPTAEQ